MNFNFNPYFLTAIFEGGAEYFTFDLICNLKYLRFAREGGGYLKDDDSGEYKHSNTYLVAEANDTGFAEATETIKFEGKTLYRFSLIYRRAAWLAISNNGQADPSEYFSTVAFDWSSEVNTTKKYENSSKQEAFEQVSQNVGLAYIDNVAIGAGSSDDITFADGNASGNLILNRAGTSCGAADVVKYGDDYALKVVTMTKCKSNTTAFGMELSYLHQVFNVAGADALTFKVYLEDTEKVDKVKLWFSGFGSIGGTMTRVDGDQLASTYDEEAKMYTFTLTKETYAKHFDENGNYIANSFKGISEISSIRMGMSSTKYKADALGNMGDYASGKGTVLYFDDFVKVMPSA
jgi:hypothetical protein